jgi:hypothetical protein
MEKIIIKNDGERKVFIKNERWTKKTKDDGNWKCFKIGVMAMDTR